MIAAHNLIYRAFTVNMNTLVHKMKLCIADINDVSENDISRISNERAEKAKRYRRTDDRKRCIAGGLLIKKFLGGTNLTVNKYGKPTADNGMYFNLSHSGRYILFALSDAEVGCDIESIKIIDAEKLGKIVFCKNEMNGICSSTDKTGKFYEFWTKKESFLKCIGKGFHRNAKSVDVTKDSFDDNGKTYYFKVFKFSDYNVSVCSTENDFPDIIEFIDLKMF